MKHEWGEEEEAELQGILARGRHYPTTNLFLPLDEDAERYGELIEKKCNFLWAEYRGQHEGDWNS